MLLPASRFVACQNRFGSSLHSTWTSCNSRNPHGPQGFGNKSTGGLRRAQSSRASGPQIQKHDLSSILLRVVVCYVAKSFPSRDPRVLQLALRRARRLTPCGAMAIVLQRGYGSHKTHCKTSEFCAFASHANALPVSAPRWIASAKLAAVLLSTEPSAIRHRTRGIAQIRMANG